jgi:hypothetical protein
MVFAKILITYSDGRWAAKETLNQPDLGNQLNFFQDAIIAGDVKQVLVEAVDPLAQSIAELFNSTSSDLELLTKTRKAIYDQING